LLAGGLVLWAMATFFTGFVGGLAALVSMRFLLGIGEGVAFPCASKIIASHVLPRHRGIANGAVASALAIGPALGTFAGGLIDGAPTKLTVPYSVARAMFVEGNQQAAMQAFMSGQIKVEGDMTKLMAMQGQNSGGGEDMQKKLQEITAPD